ncbi:MAG: penicillin-binding transpeptidase domain-containing protein [Terriglobia bacterium]|jgi:cell division protein FtsI/penicillin-binding protein 2|nr:penicillin-binding transpeptidase domain-containing protein [Terriglobia bacterium]
MTRRLLPIALFSVLVSLFLTSAFAASVSTKRYKKSSQKVAESKRAKRRISHLRHSRTVARATAVRTRRRVVSRRSRRHRYYERFTASSFTNQNLGAGDVTAGEDPVVRAAAIEALGNYNGTVVAINPSNGRILAMVNQKLALSQGATPCSTIKLSVALAALSEGIVTKDTKVSLGKHWSIDMTQALAHSNNAYFEALGRKLGFERVQRYAHEFGLGELAGYDIPGEHLGTYPDEVLPAKLGGVGRMCSFGEGVSMTPLQLGAMVAAMANGGTLYYLQHPTTPQQIANFQPKVKRYLNIAPLLPEVQPGMMGAVQYGTARSVRYNFSEEQILGKTGTCSKAGTRFGWFASYADTQFGRIVTVVFLEGGRPTFGPKAAEIAGKMYRDLYDHSYFAERASVKNSDGNAIGATQ